MEAVSSQQQQRKLSGKKMFIHMWLWTCCPFKERGGRQRTASHRGSVKRYGFLSVLWRTYGSTVCPSPPIRPLPLLPFLRRSSLLSLRPLPNGNGSFLVAKSDSFFSVRVVTACRSWQSDLACLSPVSRSTDHIADSCTHDLLAGFLSSTLVDLLTLAKKNWDSHAKQNDTERDSHAKQNYRRVHARESTRLCPQRRAVVSNFLAKVV